MNDYAIEDGLARGSPGACQRRYTANLTKPLKRYKKTDFRDFRVPVNLRAKSLVEEQIMAEQEKPPVDDKPEEDDKETILNTAPPVKGMDTQQTAVEVAMARGDAVDVHIFSAPTSRVVPVVKHGNFLANGDENASREFRKILGDLIDDGLESMASGLHYEAGSWHWALFGTKLEARNMVPIPFENAINDPKMTPDEKLAAAKAEIAAELATPAAAEKTG